VNSTKNLYIPRQEHYTTVPDWKAGVFRSRHLFKPQKRNPLLCTSTTAPQMQTDAVQYNRDYLVIVLCST